MANRARKNSKIVRRNGSVGWGCGLCYADDCVQQWFDVHNGPKRSKVYN